MWPAVAFAGPWVTEIMSFHFKPAREVVTTLQDSQYPLLVPYCKKYKPGIFYISGLSVSYL